MRVTLFTLAKSKIPGFTTVSWKPGGMCMVYLDGTFAVGPVDSGSADILIPPGTHAIEIVEGEDYLSSDDCPFVRPEIQWIAVENADLYRIVIDGIIRQTIPADGRESYSCPCPVRLSSNGGEWHRVRVDAVTNKGVTNATTLVGNYWAMDLPREPSLKFSNKNNSVILTIRGE